ncbi:MAG: 16S rRNA (cytosine(967)-C(5))-methyltransferase RsmB [Desulfobacteraceae bacterium]|nr:16S rRNA (cytosine(967)-C(5))-methyltransferase RsmB [Desulfobacteraceae bacterium]
MNTADPRKAALYILNKLSKGRSNLDRIIDEQEAGVFLHMPRRDRALANALVYGVLRWRAKLDFNIEAFASRPVKQIKPEVLNILRIGLFQMMFLSRIPQSAAVNTSVEMAKQVAPKSMAGFVNALLRNYARSPQSPPYPDFRTDPLAAIAVCQSFPQWLVSRWEKRFGFEETRSLCEYLNKIPPVTIRVNLLKTTRNQVLEKLAPCVGSAEKTRISRTGIALYGMKKPVYELPGFSEGMFQVQDEAPQLATPVLSPKPGENVLDACAGLGGKTGHIAQLMENRGKVVAADTDSLRLKALESEMERLGVNIVETRCLDMEKPGVLPGTESFDRILIDAPCSGLGVIRRNPDIKWSVGKNDFKRYHSRQTRILETTAKYLKPGGAIVYAVCSMEPEETDAVVEEFCEKLKDFKVEPIGKHSTDPAANPDKQGYLRLYPHQHNTDGFFIARIIHRP